MSKISDSGPGRSHRRLVSRPDFPEQRPGGRRRRGEDRRAATSPARPRSSRRSSRRSPTNKVALRYLGFAYIKLKKYPEGRADLREAARARPRTRRRPSTTPASSYALEGNKDAAFEWLGKAKATGKLDMTQIQVDEDLKPLSADPRFAALLPKPAGLREPLRRVGERRAHPRVGRRGTGRPVRLDRAEPRRRGRRRRRGLRHFRADVVRRRQGGRPRLRLLDEDRQAPLEGRRRYGRRARHGHRARGRREQGRRPRRRRRRARRRQGAHLFGQGRPRAPDAHGRGQDRRLRPARHDGRRRRTATATTTSSSARRTTPPAARTRGARTSTPARTAGSSTPGRASARATTSAPPPPATRAAK